ncbi:CCA tRNA nucleotidyltransferase [Alkalihalobacillus hwajinpoensis]|uniref:CCA tRNA nucleotidyltransferase n=1 Tax=Guptibacillus hwajinpoensis TaxID=208199 RepID=UPI001883EAFE|nr:CCA tRNA nucleotidyltransferase [Pseudalkalibacillus hwajinpoensis]MBF0708976.1 CCA tRNA nucleotidyltransferase [Pseudalkalibacillus hwajinpoensis]
MIDLKGKAYNTCMEVLHILTEDGFEAYIVGGAVRDALLGIPVADFDIASSAKPEEVMRLFDKVVPTGIDHGTVTVVYKEFSFEVTTFRSEKGYRDFRHPSAVSFLGTIEDDLGRRDFTINSMALSIKGDVIDLYDGLDDLKRRLLRTVGDPAERFQEDALRMVRALRFQSVLDFSLDKETEEALILNAPLLKRVAIERIQIEISKLLYGKAVHSAINQLVQAHLHQILPGLQNLEKWLEETRYLHYLATEEERWAFLARTTDDPVRFLKEWRLPNRIVKKVEFLLRNVDLVKSEGWSRWRIYEAIPEVRSCERLLSVFEKRPPNLLKVDRITSELVITSAEMLGVTGEELIKWKGTKPGPWVGEALKQIEHAVITEEIKNEKSSIKRWLEQWQTQ